MPGLYLPAGTGQVQLALFAHGRSLRGVGERDRWRAARRSRGRRAPPAAIRRSSRRRSRCAPRSPAYVPATVCVRPLDGPVGIGGTAGLPFGSLPAGSTARRSNSGSRSGSCRRSARSARCSPRPARSSPGPRCSARAIVGAWTYPVLLFVDPAARLAAGAAAAGPRRRRGVSLRLRGRMLRPAALIALIAFVNAGSWALITPAFNAPDEPDHFAYGQYLATTGHAPARTPDARVPFSTDETLAMNAVDIYGQSSSPDRATAVAGDPAARRRTAARLDAPSKRQRRRSDPRRLAPSAGLLRA